jgi:hypothetical protein
MRWPYSKLNLRSHNTAAFVAAHTLPQIALQECEFCGARLPPSKTRRTRCSKHTPLYGAVPQNDIADDITRPVPVRRA